MTPIAAKPVTREDQLAQAQRAVDEAQVMVRVWAEIKTTLMVTDEEEMKVTVGARLEKALAAREKASRAFQSIRDQTFVVVPKSDQTITGLLAGLPTPALIDACNDGQWHEGWQHTFPDSPGFIQFRLRDDRFDANYKPVYVMVRITRLND